MLKNHPLNYTESLQLKERLGDMLESKGCYTNVFHSIIHSGGKFTTGEWKVAYGYVQVLEGAPLMARHCFIVNSKGEAIDPSLVNITGFREDEERGHVSFAIFESLDAYLDAVSENDNVPDLIKPFKAQERKISQTWAPQNGRFIIG